MTSYTWSYRCDCLQNRRTGGRNRPNRRNGCKGSILFETIQRIRNQILGGQLNQSANLNNNSLFSLLCLQTGSRYHIKFCCKLKGKNRPFDLFKCSVLK